MKTHRSKSKKGQNTAEYILMLVLVAGGAIGAFKIFGNTVFDRLKSVTAMLEGKAGHTATDRSNSIETNWDMESTRPEN